MNKMYALHITVKTLLRLSSKSSVPHASLQNSHLAVTLPNCHGSSFLWGSCCRLWIQAQTQKQASTTSSAVMRIGAQPFYCSSQVWSLCVTLYWLTNHRFAIFIFLPFCSLVLSAHAHELFLKLKLGHTTLKFHYKGFG